MAKEQSLLATIRSMRHTGNPWYCLLTEPLWGIPYTLYMPFAAVYMQMIGLSSVEIGIIATITIASRVVGSMLSGPLADKLGRKNCTFIFDLLAWSVPTLLWAFAQNFTWFAVAAACNGFMAVTMVSWNCLMVEDAEESKLVQLFTLMYIAGQISVFVSPLAALLVNRFDVVTVVRGLYLFAFVAMTSKFIILQVYAKETRMGKIRMRETKPISFGKMVLTLWHVLRDMLRRPSVIFTMILMSIATAVQLINNNFWALLVTNKLGIEAEFLGIFVFVKSAVQLLCYFLIAPHISTYRFRNPLMIGWGIFIASQAMLFVIPSGAVVWVGFYVVLEAIAISMVIPIADSLVILNTDPRERARNMGITYAAVQMLVLPFGYVGGLLSDIERALPFALNIALMIVGTAMAVLIHRARKKETESEDAAHVQAVK